MRGVPKAIDGMRECTDCQKVLPVSEFYRHSQKPNTTCSRCKACAKASSRASSRANPELVSRRNRKHWLKSKYGLSWEQFSAMVNAQNGCCAICRDALNFETWHRMVHIDHDHTTGKVRGVLCGRCNPALGAFRDSPEILEAAAGYLRAHRHLKAVA